MTYLQGLNTEQKQAVMHVDGPLLILAGAGSGKTRVLTCRIARLVDELAVSPRSILAITFTNKAAREMKERIANLVGDVVRDMWVSTFHSMCVRILRRDIEKLGYTSNFVIYDPGDQSTLIKDCIEELKLNKDNYPVRSVLSEIGRAKDKMLEPKEYLRSIGGEFRLEKYAQIYDLYQKKLKENNAMDFDDIIMLTVRLFKEYPSVLEYYQNKFRYILVDEYQDTNITQYMLVKMLAAKHKNLCVVGDDDQSIYGWRGADITNILEFEKDYDHCTVIKLEQNYRSTPQILEAANIIIKNNVERKQKKLWTAQEKGDKINLYKAANHLDEARFVVSEIQKEMAKNGRAYDDFAIIYRGNVQSRAFEDELVKRGLPYKIHGGFKFYDRQEIKDVLAYLRTILNPNDNISLKRIINVPKRGIGTTTVDRAENLAINQGVSLYDILKVAPNVPELAKAVLKLDSFVTLIERLRECARVQTVTNVIREVLDSTKLIELLEKEDTVESRSRIENLEELINVAAEFEKQAQTEDEEPSLENFLSKISLQSDSDEIDEEAGQVMLMTMHSAKGLEFPVVFMVAMDDGIFPSYRSLESETGIEEERRLCYVGITRAREKLYMTTAFSRMLYGKTERYMISRFVEELPEEMLSIQGGENDFSFGGPVRSSIRPATTQRTEIPYGMLRRGSQVIGNQPSAPSFGKKLEAVAQNEEFVKGDRVVHKKFGAGTVALTEGKGDKQQIEIDFDSVGKRRLMTVYANLKRE